MADWPLPSLRFHKYIDETYPSEIENKKKRKKINV